MHKREARFHQIVNMNFGFLGIQFGWGLQMANMTAIYRKLGAQPDDVPILWLAAPLTGLIVQPIIGAMSDRTWTRLGRRRPYFLGGALLASAALAMMPRVGSLWMAAALLWVLDASINVSMEPFRAFVADKLEERQRTIGFAVQSLLIGVGATMANLFPYLLERLGVRSQAANGVPLTVQYAFQVGAALFLAAVLWTVITTGEEPPEELAAGAPPPPRTTARAMLAEIVEAARAMPQTMRQLALVQVFTWLGLFCMFLFFGAATARYVFGASDPHSELYDRGVAWGGVCFAAYSAVTMVVALVLPRIAARTSRKAVHATALVCGAAALLSVGVIRSPLVLLVVIGLGVGVAWPSILSMPYAMLARVLPQNRVGVYMGLFNFFIVIPEILAALTFRPIVKYVFGNNEMYVVMLGGVSMLAAAALVARVVDPGEQLAATPERASETLDTAA